MNPPLRGKYKEPVPWGRSSEDGYSYALVVGAISVSQTPPLIFLLANGSWLLCSLIPLIDLAAVFRTESQGRGDALQPYSVWRRSLSISGFRGEVQDCEDEKMWRIRWAKKYNTCRYKRELCSFRADRISTFSIDVYIL